MRLIVLLILFLGLRTAAQVPQGGVLLNASTGTTFQKIGKGNLTQVNVDNQSFVKALRYTTGQDITNTWDAQIKFPSVAGFSAGDVMLVAFYARTLSSTDETGSGYLMVCIEHSTTYVKEIYQRVTIGGEWKQYFVPLKAVSSLVAGNISYAFHMGFVSQSLEVADVQFLNYKTTLTLNDLPVTEITYGGREPDAAWRAAAAERIQQFRKGIAAIEVYDSEGYPVGDAKIAIEMVRHQFGFGSAIDANTFLNNPIYRRRFFEMFNEAVFENDLKWSAFNPLSINTHIKWVIDSLDARTIPVRGHTVIWPSFRYNPTSVKSLEDNPAALRNAIDLRIDQVSRFTSGRLNDWDVLNEPYTETDFMDILGREVMADWFRRVRNNDRAVKLYINDFGIISGSGVNTVKQDGYMDIIRYIEDQGGEIDGIGFQGHFGSDLTSIPRVYSIIDKFAAMGKEIKITEHDISITQRQVQADYTRDFMTIVFSHPSVKSLMVWGFWAGRHWRPDAAFYNSIWGLLPHGQVWKDQVYKEWWTPKDTLLSGATGKASFEGFLGTYKYTVEAGGKKRTGTFKLEVPLHGDKKNRIVLSPENGLPDRLDITSSQPGCLCEGEEATLQAPAGEGLIYSWYRDSVLLGVQSSRITVSTPGRYHVKMVKGSLELISQPYTLSVDTFPVAEITVAGPVEICPGDKAVLSTSMDKKLTYNWMKGNARIAGSVSSVEISESGTYTLEATYRGCTTVSEPVNITVLPSGDSRCTTGLELQELNYRVYPNPFRGYFKVETSLTGQSEVNIELLDATGSCVYQGSFLQSGERIIVAPAPGFYTLRIRNQHGTHTVKLIGL